MKISILLVMWFLQTSICSFVAHACDLESAEHKEDKSLTFPINNLIVLLNSRLTDKSEKDNTNRYSQYEYQSLKQLKQICKTLPCSVDYASDSGEFCKLLADEKKVNFVLDLQNNPENSAIAYMEKYGVKYSHSGKQLRERCADKFELHQIASALQIPYPLQKCLNSKEILPNEPITNTNDIFPAFIKPRYGQGNFGICQHSRVESLDDLREKFPIIHNLFPSIEEWVLQEYLPGTEYTIVVIGNGDEHEILPIATHTTPH